MGCQGDAPAPHAAGEAALDAAAAMGGFIEDVAYVVLADPHWPKGMPWLPRRPARASWGHTVPQRAVFVRSLNPMPEALLACGELVAGPPVGG